MEISYLDKAPIKVSSHHIRKLSFSSNASILSSDLVIWDMTSTKNSASPFSLIEKSVNIYNSYVNNRKEEFSEYLDNGGVLIVLRPDIDAVNNGNGIIDLWNAIGIKKPTLKAKEGRSMYSKLENESLEAFISTFANNLSFFNVIEDFEGTPVFYLKNTDKVVSYYTKVKNGLVLFAPYFGERIDGDPNLFYDLILKFTKFFLNSSPSIPFKLPTLAEEYILAETQEITLGISSTQKKIDELQKLLAKKQSEFDRLNLFKHLFLSTGDDLEYICDEVFKEIGFKTVKSENRHDLILIYKKNVAVVEIKGVTKSAKESHAVQLQKWSTEYHLKHELNPKSILIVNAFYNLPLDKRIGASFPDQMIPYSTQMGQCLITGIQLFNLYMDFRNNKISSDQIIELLFSTVGVLDYSSDIKSHLV